MTIIIGCFIFTQSPVPAPLELVIWGQIDVSVDKSTHCLCRCARFDSQHPQKICKGSDTLLALCAHRHVGGEYNCTCRQNVYAHKIYFKKLTKSYSGRGLILFLIMASM